jgi:hypothetical protein
MQYSFHAHFPLRQAVPTQVKRGDQILTHNLIIPLTLYLSVCREKGESYRQPTKQNKSRETSRP